MSNIIQAALAEVRRQKDLAGKATPGPWDAEPDHHGIDGSYDEPFVHANGTRVCTIRIGIDHSKTNGPYIADARNTAERNLALLEALLEHWELCPEDETDQSRERKAVERALAAFVEVKR